jgi:S1-C subfamily serine protease
MNVYARVVCQTITAVLLLATVSVDAARPWAWLGVRIRDLSEQEMDDLSKAHGIKEGFGVFIVDVLQETPAARAGLKNGDIVVAFEGRPVTETRLLQRLIAGAPPESEVRLVVLRREGRRAVPVRLASMPRDVAGDRVAALFGFFLREPAPPDAAATAGTPAVAAVEKGSLAERGGLRIGDVVLQVNEQPVVSRDAAREALAEASPERPLRLVVRRDDERVVLTLDPTPKGGVP